MSPRRQNSEFVAGYSLFSYNKLAQWGGCMCTRKWHASSSLRRPRLGSARQSTLRVEYFVPLYQWKPTKDSAFVGFRASAPTHTLLAFPRTHEKRKNAKPARIMWSFHFTCEKGPIIIIALRASDRIEASQNTSTSTSSLRPARFSQCNRKKTIAF